MSWLNRCALLGCLAIFVALAISGCSGNKPDTPQAVVERFVKAVQEDDMATAADLMAWQEIARRQNPDWDNFPSSQRNLIIGRLKQQKQGELKHLAGFLRNATVGQASVEGDGAEVIVTGSGATVVFDLIAEGGKQWRILTIRPRTQGPGGMGG